MNIDKSSKTAVYSNWSPLKPEIDALLACLEYENISKACERVGINQASLSKLIQKIEQQLGQKLFFRSARGIKPTPVCVDICNSIKSTKKFWTAEVQNIFLLQKQVQKKIHIGCHSSVAMQNLPGLFEPLLKKYPDTLFDFSFNRSVEVTRQISNREIDIGIVINPVKNSELVTKDIKDEFIALWGNSLSPVVFYNSEMFMGEKILKILKNRQLIQIPDYEVIAATIKNSSFNALLPSDVASRYKLNLLGGKLLNARLSVVWHKERFQFADQKQFIRDLVEILLQRS